MGCEVKAAPKINERGTTSFCRRLHRSKRAPGERTLSHDAEGTAHASFEVLAPLNRAGRFQGFSPNDVMYLIMIDRFSDGDQSNNDPPQSRGIYDRKNKFYYHGGDLQGVIDRLPYLKDLGVTASGSRPGTTTTIDSTDRVEGRQAEHRISWLQPAGLLRSRGTLRHAREAARTRRAAHRSA